MTNICIQEARLLAKMGYDVAAMYLMKASYQKRVIEAIVLVNKAIAELKNQAAPSWLFNHVARHVRHSAD